MKLSVIIPSRNTKQLVMDCLLSLVDTIPPLNGEVVLVDNGSVDGTPEAVRRQFPQVRIIENGSNLGFGRACNIGARASTGEALLFLNTDTRVRADSLGLLVSVLESRPEVGIVAPQLIGPDGALQETSSHVVTPRIELSSRARRQARAELARALESDADLPSTAYFSGAALGVRRDAFEQAGGFDESIFFYFEDMDLCRRIATAGWMMTFARDARVVHLGGASSKAVSVGASIEMMRSRCRLIRKHHGLAAAVVVGSAHFLGRSRRTLVSALGMLLTLGLNDGFRKKAGLNGAICLWFVCGMPDRGRWIYRWLFCDWGA